MTVIADGESIRAVIALAPPSVENAEVNAPMAASLLTARAGRFQRTAGIIQPDVTAGDHLAGDVNIVILNEDEVAF